MIEFTDITLRQSGGNFDATQKLMAEDVGSGTWMLRTEVLISNEFATGQYLLHLWNDGNVVIQQVLSNKQVESSDEDLRELSEWCRINGWKNLKIQDSLLTDRRSREYWRRGFLAGLVKSDLFQREEDDQFRRLSEAQNKE